MTTLQQRREWYRFFPEGTLEFLIITRVLGLGALLALSVAGGAYRPLVWGGVVALLWLDYLLVLWWLLQVNLDARLASPGEGPQPQPLAAYGLIALPSLAVIALLAALTSRRGLSLPAALGLLAVLAALMFVGSTGLKRARLGAGIWGLLLMVPGLHWPAVHRLSAELADRMVEPDAQPARASGSRTLLRAASVVWLVTLLPWLVLVILTLSDAWPERGRVRFAPLCAMAPAIVFAVLDLAAMENVQQRFVAWVKRAGRS